MERIERRAVLPAPSAQLWRALTEGAHLSAWFGAAVELDPRPGGRARFLWPDGWERGAIVELVERHRRLSFRWLPFERSPGGAVRTSPAGRVELELREVEEGTELTVTEWIGVGPARASRPAAPIGASR